ncbi:hypothetical protein ACQJ0O_03510 [Pseudomonas shirazensis]|uniref:hypothetical protein n=1 Tax=Pseudomonas shirazensis TaxID=2745494 RepID=UPI003D0207B8
MFECPNLVMPNAPDLVQKVRDYLDRFDPPHKIVYLRSLVSSPRLSDHFVRGLDSRSLVLVADSFLSEHTMLGDHRQRSFGVSLKAWAQMRDRVEIVEDFHFTDTTVCRIQVWPFDPSTLDLEAMKIAVALSITDLEMDYEPRICGAVRDLLIDYKIEPYSGA